MTAYYNEIDEKAAAWLRELIRRDLIAPGDVDTRSIEDVSPDDLRPYTQCHFFAGIGVWSYALRLAGWPDDRPVWTGSCPCQPFSAAGKGGGFADERHLWPAMLHLIRERRPVVWLGEQVASKDGLGWLDLVQADLEGEDYAVGAVDTCSAGFGAPHIRQRLRIAAQRLDHAAGPRHVGSVGDTEGLARDEARLRLSGAGSEVERVADTGRQRDEPRRDAGDVEHSSGEEQGQARERQRSRDADCDGCAVDGVEHASGDGRIERRPEPSGRGAASGRGAGGLAEPYGRQCCRVAELRGTERDGQDAGWPQGGRGAAARGDDGGLADTAEFRRVGRRADEAGAELGTVERSDGLRAVGGLEHPELPAAQPRQRLVGGAAVREQDAAGLAGTGVADRLHGDARDAGLLRRQAADTDTERPGPVNGFWRAADWLHCRDGKWRPVEPGTFPLAHGASARVGRLRGYGNAVDAIATKEFIEAAAEAFDDLRLMSDLTTDKPEPMDIFS